MTRLLLVSFLTLLGACSSRTAGGGCKGNDACEGGSVCIGDTCQLLCSNDLNCEGSCCDGGVCGASCASRAAPQVHSVDGTGTADDDLTHATHHVVDRLIIRGQNLAGAVARMTVGSSEVDLQSCGDSTDSQMQVLLPEAVTAGSYALTVVNQAGSCAASVTLLQGEAGEDGPQGPPGTKGGPGDAGPRGPQGDPGVGLNTSACAADDVFAYDEVTGEGTCRPGVSASANSFNVAGTAGISDPAGASASMLIQTAVQSDSVMRSVLRMSGGAAPSSLDMRWTSNDADEYRLRIGKSNMHYKGTLTVDGGVQLSGQTWNNTGSSSAAQVYVFSYETCNADTRGQIRIWRLDEFDTSLDTMDALCFCRRYDPNHSTADDEQYRWVCFHD